MRAPVFFFLSVLLACGATRSESVHGPVVAQPTRVDTALAYRTAIRDYLVAMANTDAPVPDTLFIGRHPDFPATALPDTMGGKTVRIIAPAEAVGFQEAGRFAYLNVIAWFPPGQAEFIVVRFEQGMRHRTDGRDDRQLHYSLSEVPPYFVLDSIEP